MKHRVGIPYLVLIVTVCTLATLKIVDMDGNNGLVASPRHRKLDDEVMAGEEIRTQLYLVNYSDQEIVITNANTSCGCIGVDVLELPMTLSSNQITSVTIRLDASGRSGLNRYDVVFEGIYTKSKRIVYAPYSLDVTVVRPLFAHPSRLTFDLADTGSVDAGITETFRLAHGLGSATVIGVRDFSVSDSRFDVSFQRLSSGSTTRRGRISDVFEFNVSMKRDPTLVGTHELVVNLNDGKELVIPIHVVMPKQYVVSPSEILVRGTPGSVITKQLSVRWYDRDHSRPHARVTNNPNATVRLLTNLELSAEFELSVSVGRQEQDFTVEVEFPEAGARISVPVHVRHW